MKKTYQAGSTFRFKSTDATVIGKELEKHFPDGKPKPHDLVEIARAEDSPLHRFFDWDNSVAAEKWRVHQARGILLSLHVVFEDSPDPSPHRAYFPVRIEGQGRCYMSAEKISESEELTDQVIDRAFKELERWQLQYSTYQKTFKNVLSAIADAQRRHYEGKERKNSRASGGGGKNLNPAISVEVRQSHHRGNIPVTGK